MNASLAVEREKGLNGTQSAIQIHDFHVFTTYINRRGVWNKVLSDF